MRPRSTRSIGKRAAVSLGALVLLIAGYQQASGASQASTTGTVVAGGTHGCCGSGNN